MKDYYAILEIPPNASQEEIKDQYFLLIQAWHPDKFRSPKQKAKAEEKSKEVNVAYSILKDVAKRAEYDRQLSGGPSRSVRPQKPRPAEEHRRPKPAEEKRSRPAYDWGKPEWSQAEPRHTDNEADVSALKEWVRYYFEQARRRGSNQSSAGLNRNDHTPIRVLVVGDVPDARMHIRKLLGSETDIKVVGEALDGAEALEKFGSLLPDVTTVCMNSPATSSITATEAIHRKHPLARVIMISGQSSTDYIRRAMLAGACDYLTNPPPAEDLKAAIRLAAGR